ncbi:hypothetical protein Caka_2564 [Coraliomargarita akajimensis DSM 45221]|uniref:Uncharacterized protein n=1 Tax=Coraliomargarita akajimensis (strain DSM 45221 / IAM 15411 / JCM 23193 / KCTC 12865 / 04OKA010-24) TaxID=583355 RepID=D5EP70_CORAD|nr:hypothetical protein Caka_2564 [Coraliomargarita akajimensis DSM 45221]
MEQTDAMIEKESFVSLTQSADQIESPLSLTSFCRTSGYECPHSGGCSLLSTASLRNTPMMHTQASVINPVGLTTFTEPFNQTSDHRIPRKVTMNQKKKRPPLRAAARTTQRNFSTT